MSTSFIYRIAMIVPASVVEAARRITAGMGWGENCFSAKLAASGDPETLTHYGLSTAASQGFIDALNAAGEGVVPEGVEPADLAAVLPVLLISTGANATDPLSQFEALCDANNLTILQEEQNV